ncbi:exonuclease domain-containing protein [Frigoribacterium sp. 2-23]|uniref:exonuclease domain-containing protein n=1 Tax=Frigoribacterium sp. 2-23 TaxID=3415006 RepID=UPI003C7038AE
MAHNGYAVIDFETTGLSPQHHHRVIEIGIVHVAPDGTIEDSFETVVNPGRDLGPTHIHQLRGADVKDGPTFADVADQFIDHLRGRVLVAHNSRFEATFLRAELTRLGMVSPIADEGALCTMKLATTYLPGSGRKLADCCAAFDIPLVDAHEALADARATAHLLAAYLDLGRDQASWWGQWGDYAARAAWPPAGAATSATAWVPRRRGATGGADSPRASSMSRFGGPGTTSFLERTTDRLRPVAGSGRELDYLAMLDRALSDGFLSVSESDELRALGEAIGVGPARRTELHHEYFDGLVDAAWADGILTAGERSDIESVGIMLDIEQQLRTAALDPRADQALAAREATPPPAAARLAPGDLVVLTGEMSEPREVIEQRLTARGLVVKPGITKKTTLLVSADPDSLSGKAQKARQYGIPIVGEEALATLVPTMAY